MGFREKKPETPLFPAFLCAPVSDYPRELLLPRLLA